MPNLMAAQTNIGGALCESSLISFLVLRRKVWLRPAAGVPCSNAANIRDRQIGHKVNFARSKSPQTCTCSVPAQETAENRAKFGWPAVRGVAAVIKPRRETG